VSASRTLVLASSNTGKLVELRALLGEGCQLHAQSEFGIDDADETGLSFIENAILKARHAARATGLPALADDSGLCVDALHGAPGLYSARYAGAQGGGHAGSAADARRIQDAANIDKLLRALEAVPDDARAARFVCVLALVRDADDPQPVIAEGVWHGRILRERRGAGGFGYDPVFHSHAHGCSAAELPPATKQRDSHRGVALARLRERLCDAPNEFR
jgi:XTP/dITP diphosphohydrolase